MKVLILSLEAWQDGTNGGNVLSNMFEGSTFEFAQIYCSPGTPDNNLCKKYYQMTDHMAISNILKHRQMGKAFNLEDTSSAKSIGIDLAESQNEKIWRFFYAHRLGIFYAARDIAWELSNWKNDGLRQFIDDFSPDIIFAPCYGSIFMMELTRFVVDYTGKRVISYISDDHYTLQQFRLSPYFWIKRFRLRKAMRKTFPYYSLIYTMTEEQKEQCERDFHANVKILRKSANAPEKATKTGSECIRIVYAGGIYLNRWKVLAHLADAIERVNQNKPIFHLDIYTGNDMTRKQRKLLNRENVVEVHAAVPFEKLKDIYAVSDIALHVESFDVANRLATRMSFSTKIVDCLSSGCAVMAIAWEKQAGFHYLKSNDAAICISDIMQINDVLLKIKNEQSILNHYREKALECCRQNHDVQNTRKMIQSDFREVRLSQI